MMMTRLGMKVTLCHPPGRELDIDVMKTCQGNARNSGGGFEWTSNLDEARRGQDIIYARHWGTEAMGDEVSTWFCDEKLLGDARYVHPMPVDRGVEATAEVVDGRRSLTRDLIRNKHFVQKAILARLAHLRTT